MQKQICNIGQTCMINDSFNAFCKHVNLQLTGNKNGSLADLNFAAKDLFDVTGFTCCAGNPDWLHTHQPATHTAPPIEMLLAAGASLVGKTIMDELAFSMAGKNIHYGTPINPAAPKHIPGGSSSGSAAATAGKLVDFALGTDTSGSIRTPASYCGLFGIRPTQGRISTQYMAPLAPSFDTVGWFARDGALLQRIGEILLPSFNKPQLPKHLYIASDALALVEPSIRPSIEAGIAKIAVHMSSTQMINLSNDALENWYQTELPIKLYEAWQSDGKWITETKPDLAPAIAQRFANAAQVSFEDVTAAIQRRAQIKNYLTELLTPDVFLCIPTTPGIAPLIATADSELETVRKHTLMLMAIANLGGLPQVSFPLAEFNHCPLGISLIAAPNNDAALLAMAQQFS